MTIFDLNAAVIEDYDFVGSFLTIADEGVRDFVGQALVDGARQRAQ